MSYWIEKLIVPLILMVIGGIGTVAWQYITSPEATFLSARVRWISVPNLLYPVEQKPFGDLEKAVGAAYGQAGPVLTPFKYDRELRVAVMTITNMSNVRSKEVEIIAKQDSILYSPHAAAGAKALSKKLVIGPIDPFESAEVYGLIAGWPYSVSKTVSAVYDNKRLPMIGDEPATQEFGSALAALVSEIPILSSAVMAFGVLLLLVFAFAIPVEIVASFVPRLRAKWTTEQQLKKMLDTLDIVQKEDPAKLEKARALQKPKAQVEAAT